MSQIGSDGDAPGRRFSYWLGQALSQRRKTAAIPEQAVAMLLGYQERKIRRIEGGDGEDVQSYQDIDRIIKGYAYLLGVDPRELWIDAIEQWCLNGAAPAFTETELPGVRILRPIQEEVQRKLTARDGPARTLRATLRKQRAAG